MHEEIQRSHEAAIVENEAKPEPEKTQAVDAAQLAVKEKKEQQTALVNPIEVKIKEAQLKNDPRAEAAAILEQVSDKVEIPFDSKLVKDPLTTI